MDSRLALERRRCCGRLGFCLFLLLLFPQQGKAQEKESSFAPQPNGQVFALALQPDGKILVGGDFTMLGGVSRNIIGRLNADGSFDHSFTPTASSDGDVYALAVQPDGNVIVAGSFSSMAGSALNIKRLGPNGYADSGFSAYPNGAVYAVAIQPNGKIVLGGSFSIIGTTAASRLARLNSTGALDASFNPVIIGNAVFALALQTDGKILVGGEFTELAGHPCQNIARLNADGTFDSSFNATVDDIVRSFAIRPDGKIVIGGDFAVVNGQAANRLARLNANGTRDGSFSVLATDATSIFSLLIQPDGKILVGGNFTTMGGTSRKRLARLNVTGSLDTFFNPNVDGVNANYHVYTLVLQPDGKIVLGGKFTQVDGESFSNLARIHAAGDVEIRLASHVVGPSPYVMAQQPDGNIVVGGNFTDLSGQTRYGIGRLRANGRIDTSTSTFDRQVYGTVYALAVQADNKILLGGSFTNVGGYARNRIARLNANGQVDTSFNPGANATVYCFDIQPDGKIVAGGDFTTLGAASRIRIGRIHANGTADTSFDPGSGANATVRDVVVQPDGKILVGGDFTNLVGQTRKSIGRLHPNGSIDSTFNPTGVGANEWISSLALQPDGKILVGGAFSSLGGGTRYNIGRLHTNGTLDTAFTRGGEPNSTVLQLVLTTDGRMLIAGAFSSVNGQPRRGMARLNTNGTLDTSFNANLIEFVKCFAVQEDGRIPVADQDTYVSRELFRLVVTNAVAHELDIASARDTIAWMRSGASPEVDYVVFEQSNNGTTFTPLGASRRIAGGWQLTGLSLPLEKNIWIKARSLCPAVEKVWNVYLQKQRASISHLLLLLLDE